MILKCLLKISSNMDEIYENINEYNRNADKYNKNADMLSNKTFDLIVTKLFILGKTLNISFVLIIIFFTAPIIIV